MNVCDGLKAVSRTQQVLLKEMLLLLSLSLLLTAPSQKAKDLEESARRFWGTLIIREGQEVGER